MSIQPVDIHAGGKEFLKPPAHDAFTQEEKNYLRIQRVAAHSFQAEEDTECLAEASCHPAKHRKVRIAPFKDVLRAQAGACGVLKTSLNRPGAQGIGPGVWAWGL